MMKIYDTIFYILYRSDKLYYEKMYDTNEDESVLSNAIEAYLEIVVFEVFNIIPITIILMKFLSVDFKSFAESDILYWTVFFVSTFGLNAVLIFYKKRYLRIIEKYDSYPREVIKKKIWYLVIWVLITVVLLIVAAILTW